LAAGWLDGGTPDELPHATKSYLSPDDVAPTGSRSRRQGLTNGVHKCFSLAHIQIDNELKSLVANADDILYRCVHIKYDENSYS
jgi:hypothetical protein